MAKDGTTRIYAAIVAATAWFALGLQLLILVENFIASGAGALAGVWRFLAFFTILTNALVAIVMTGKAVGGRFAPGHSLLTGTTMNIVIVGLVYHFVLSSIWDPQGRQLVADVTLHYAVPVLTLLFWLVLEPKGAVTWRDGLIWLVYPAAYLVYALVRAQGDGFYPYPFLDAPKIGVERVVMNALGLVVGFTVAGQVFVFLDGALGAAAMRRALAQAT